MQVHEVLNQLRFTNEPRSHGVMKSLNGYIIFLRTASVCVLSMMGAWRAYAAARNNREAICHKRWITLFSKLVLAPWLNCVIVFTLNNFAFIGSIWASRKSGLGFQIFQNLSPLSLRAEKFTALVYFYFGGGQQQRRARGTNALCT